MDRSKNDIWVGLFVIIGAAALVFLALQAANLLTLSFQPMYNVAARFDNIGGLKPRAAVKSAGVVVGRVSEIGFDKQAYQAVVAMDIDGRYQFPKDTFANILTSSLLGEQYVGLDVGGDEAMLGNGDTILKTQSAVVLEKLIGQFFFSKAAETPPETKQ